MHTYLFILCKKKQPKSKKKNPKKPKAGGNQLQPSRGGGRTGETCPIGSAWGGAEVDKPGWGWQVPPPGLSRVSGEAEVPCPPLLLGGGGGDGFLCQEEDSEEGSILYKAFNCRQEHKLPPPPP